MILPLLGMALWCSVGFADTVALHQDAANPLTEGWSVFRGPVNTGPINSDVGGYNAWKVEDTGGSQEGGYEVALTTQQLTDAAGEGWTLRVRLRIIDNNQPVNDAVIAGINLGSSGFILNFGATNGTPIVSLIGGPSATLTGYDNGYHLYELVYDPAVGSADVLVDGVEQISNFTGWNGTFLDETIAFGSGAGGGGGAGHYNLVQLEIGGVASVGFQTQLFLDDFIIEQRQNVARKAQPATKMDQPVLNGQYPWEEEVNIGENGKRTLVYGTAFFDPLEGEYRMWYMGRMGGNSLYVIPELEIPGENIHNDLTSFATSRDGVHWDRPNLGVVHFDGDLKNNIMLDFHGVSVFLDEDEPDPNQRYKAIGFMRRFHEIRMCFSPDGIHWTAPQFATDRGNEGAFNACYVPGTDNYVAGSLERSTDPAHQYIDADGDPQGKRVVAVLRTDSKDLTDWVHKRFINPDGLDDPDTQFYGMTPFTYGDSGLILGFLHVFHVIDPAAGFHDGPIDAQLVYSRNGLTWKRLDDRQPVIPLGPPGSFDGGMIMQSANGVFLEDDELVAYYTASPDTHGSQFTLTVGRASWPRDRLVALHADGVLGTVTTQPFVLAGEILRVNVDATGGNLQVEVLDEAGSPIPGFTLADANLYNNVDELRLEPQWITHQNLLSLAGQTIRLKFHLTNAKLYAFKISTSQRDNFETLTTLSDDWLKTDSIDTPPLLHLRLEETATSGTVALADATGAGNTCNVTQIDGSTPTAVNWSDSSCPGDMSDDFGALDLADTTNCIDVAAGAMLQNLGEQFLGNEATFSCWWYNYADSAVKNRGVFFHGSDVLGGSIKFQAFWQNDVIWFGDSTIQVLAAFDQDNYKNTWTHFAFVGDSNVSTIYINGDVYASGNGLQNGFGGAGAIRIGARTDSQWNNITDTLQYARLDDVRIYDRALTETQIEEIMNCSEGPSFYLPLKSPANLSPKVGDEGLYNPNNPDVVNFNDFAVFTESNH